MNKTIEISISGERHDLGYPKTGQLFDIESKIHTLSNGKYGDMISTATESSLNAILLINAIACFSTLIPSFSKRVKVNILDLSPIDDTVIELVREYNKYSKFKARYDELLSSAWYQKKENV